MISQQCIDEVQAEEGELGIGIQQPQDISGFCPPSELKAPATLKPSTHLWPGPATPNPSTSLSPPLRNPAATPGEDVGKGILVDESIVREPEEVRLRGMDAREEPSDGDEGSEEVVSSGRVALSL